ncbi:hypothetical protein BDM02DRAFT_3124511 [Thelephora ganbajun]|uniref:Uncharacterized protein n=1 Tax=Thelephora ganbajun TaxID=370292 RepID=A0ACB6YYY0_THEGA|nr:hypothetical protein BDM02DRAFT_3124511 [Thelephora ganbajun]
MLRLRHEMLGNRSFVHGFLNWMWPTISAANLYRQYVLIATTQFTSSTERGDRFLWGKTGVGCPESLRREILGPDEKRLGVSR